MKQVSVSVKKTQLRREPSFLAPIIRNLEYATSGDLQEEQGDWKLVRFGNIRGWVHGAALMTGEIVLNAGSDDVERAASNREIALAGKGFSASVERNYRQNHKNVNFKAVDQMEKRIVGTQSLNNFINAGKLNRV
jgi:hypothetical protein